MNQIEKLASAMYLVKSAGMQEKLQDAMRYVKHIFNPPTDEEVWASMDKIRPVDVAKVAPDTGNLVKGLGLGLPTAAAITLGGLGLGSAAGRKFGPRIPDIIRRITKKPVLGVRVLEELEDPRFSEVVGGMSGLLLGAGTGGSVGGKIHESFIKDDIIKKMREAGYPKN